MIYRSEVSLIASEADIADRQPSLELHDDFTYEIGKLKHCLKCNFLTKINCNNYIFKK